MKTKRSLLEQCNDALEFIFTGKSNYYYSNKIYFEQYLDEVRRDIGELKDGMEDSKFERDKDVLFKILVREYQKNYCPSHLYKYFSFENQLKYLELRVEIDDILGRIDQPHSDFFSAEQEY